MESEGRRNCLEILSLPLAPKGECQHTMEELEKSMYFGATPVTLHKARHLRNRMTPEENLLWEQLKNKKCCQVRFRRQHPINTFIVDFYCHTAKLVIELDGEIHLRQKQTDAERTQVLEELGLSVIRFSNLEIKENLDSVMDQITNKVNIILHENNDRV